MIPILEYSIANHVGETLDVNLAPDVSVSFFIVEDSVWAMPMIKGTWYSGSAIKLKTYMYGDEIGVAPAQELLTSIRAALSEEPDWHSVPGVAGGRLSAVANLRSTSREIVRLFDRKKDLTAHMKTLSIHDWHILHLSDEISVKMFLYDGKFTLLPTIGDFYRFDLVRFYPLDALEVVGLKEAKDFIDSLPASNWYPFEPGGTDGSKINAIKNVRRAAASALEKLKPDHTEVEALRQQLADTEHRLRQAEEKARNALDMYTLHVYEWEDDLRLSCNGAFFDVPGKKATIRAMYKDGQDAPIKATINFGNDFVYTVERDDLCLMPSRAAAMKKPYVETLL